MISAQKPIAPDLLLHGAPGVYDFTEPLPQYVTAFEAAGCKLERFGKITGTPSRGGFQRFVYSMTSVDGCNVESHFRLRMVLDISAGRGEELGESTELTVYSGRNTIYSHRMRALIDWSRDRVADGLASLLRDHHRTREFRNGLQTCRVAQYVALQLHGKSDLTEQQINDLQAAANEIDAVLQRYKLTARSPVLIDSITRRR